MSHHFFLSSAWNTYDFFFLQIIMIALLLSDELSSFDFKGQPLPTNFNEIVDFFFYLSSMLFIKFDEPNPTQ